MDQQDVLAQVEEARERVAQTIAHAEAGHAQIEEVFNATNQHFGALTADFNYTLAHFAAEATRAKDVAQQVIDALLKAGQEAMQATEDSRRALADLVNSAHDATTHNDGGSAALETHTRQVAKRSEDTRALFKTVEDGTGQARDHQHEGIAALETALGNWRRQTDAKSHEKHVETDTLVRSLSDQHVPEFNSHADQAMEAARAALEQERHTLEDSNQQQIEHLRNDRERSNDELKQMLDQMGDALNNLKEFASSTATTLTHGADEAKDLMTLTNIGVKTIIGLIENLQKIFDEIESAWDS